MRRIYKYFLFIAVFGACADQTEVAEVDQRTYLPLQKGWYQVYAVTATTYSAAADDPVEENYQLKTVVVDSFLQTNETDYTYVIYRYQRDDEEDTWEYTDTWSARVNELRAIVAEGTTDYVKLAFPLSTGRTWDGNAYNTDDEEDYEIQSDKSTQTVGSLSFDDCYEVIQSDLDDTIVMTDLRSEVYAPGVGLVYKQETILNFCTLGCSGIGEIESGEVYEQSIIEYGIE